MRCDLSCRARAAAHGTVLLFLLSAGAVFGEDDPVGVNRRVNDPLGHDGYSQQLGLEGCLQATDPGPYGPVSTCDDEPKNQNEPSIAVAPWNPLLLLASWNDHSKQFLNAAGSADGPTSTGFAISRDGGVTWQRFAHDLPACDYECDPNKPTCLLPGSSVFHDDVGVDPSGGAGCTSWLLTSLVDPSAAIGGNGWFYLGALAGGIDDEIVFARMHWSEDEVTVWKPGWIPGFSLGDDMPHMTANPENDDVFVHWMGSHWIDGGEQQSVIKLAASRNAGCEWLLPFDSRACEGTGGPSQVVRAISHCPAGDPAPCGSVNGAYAAMGPGGVLHQVWADFRLVSSAPENLDQFRYRKVWWNGNDLVADPPFPPSDFGLCTEGQTCGRRIVFGQPGYAEGFRTLSIAPGYSAVGLSHNFLHLNSLPSIAVDNDQSNLSDRCSRRGTVYVVYAAEEPLMGDLDIYGVCDPNRTIDANIYMVRSRDGGHTWLPPVLLTPARSAPCAPCPSPDIQVCDEPFPPGGDGEIPCGRHFPFQLFPVVAVDPQGRVGVAYYDTTVDNPVDTPYDGPDIDDVVDGSRCDKRLIYQVKFTWSLDGGATWEGPVTVSDVRSDTQITHTDPILQEVLWMFFGDYMGVVASTDNDGVGLFRVAWNDLREWGGRFGWAEERNHANITPGDIYMATVTLVDPPYRMGDYDRDGDVDTDDMTYFTSCSGQSPLPLPCEILDFDRDGIITKFDQSYFSFCLKASIGAVYSETRSLGALADWTMSVMTETELSTLAEELRETSEIVTDPNEAQRIQNFADQVDPQ